ncbi:MAG: hypothetical protein A2161_14000 [Candidatus Schekmanbacteria bacterium RBG_13_48_7]|uniref:Uncharacterized protein n=1 Tax=Candidatus Schekmanbacteria bacterium RBG_13_48_7 TaxID=1817878 RepID=A0A1F7S1F6_9BACT|nr:MAG: hypothetical protein A2161_14000 [Candidatus Schekmanbacteria bacterium RBG_13_48_7]
MIILCFRRIALFSGCVYCIIFILLSSTGYTVQGIPELGFGLSSDNIEECMEMILQSTDGYRIIIFPETTIGLKNGIFNMENKPPGFDKLSGLKSGDKLYYHLQLRIQEELDLNSSTESLIQNQVESLLPNFDINNELLAGVIVDIDPQKVNHSLLTFTLSLFAVKLKAKNDKLQIITALTGDPFGYNQEFIEEITAYYDAIGIDGSPELMQRRTALRDLGITQPVFLRLKTGELTELAKIYLDNVFFAGEADPGSEIEMIWFDGIAPREINQLSRIKTTLDDHIAQNYTTIDTNTSPYKLTQASGENLEQRIYTDSQATQFAILGKVPQGKNVAEKIVLYGSGSAKIETAWFDPIENRELLAEEIKKEGTSLIQAVNCTSLFVFISIKKLDQEKAFASSMKVTAIDKVTAEEVIAHWQRYNESQKSYFQNYTADCQMDMHFAGTSLGNGFDVTIMLGYFWNRKGISEWEQTKFLLNGLELKTRRGFPFPQLEPEKMLVKPMELKLNKTYIYSYQKVEEIAGHPCHLIEFRSTEKGISYSGSIWIDAYIFRMVRMLINQTGMEGTVSANEEIQTFELIDDNNGHLVNILKEVISNNQLNAAGRNFLLEKRYQFSNFRLNTISFETELLAARERENPMFQDTDIGIRELRVEDGERVLKSEVDMKNKAIVGGLLYDGSLDYPIPLFGYSFTDFDFRKSGSQLSVFFAGPILASNLSKQWANGYRFSVDLALSAIPGNNELYVNNKKIDNETYSIWEEIVGIRNTWQMTTGFSITGSTHFSYNYFKEPDDRDPAYLNPRNGFNLTPSIEIQYTSRGYNFETGGSWTRRIDWQGYGYEPDPKHNNYTKYFSRISKNFYISSFTKIGIELSYFGGEKQDRFSRYRPGFFSEPSIKGIPSGTDDFDNVGVASASFGFNAFDFIRLETNYSHAWAQNKSESLDYVNFDGVDVGFGTIGPWETYMQGTVAYAINGNLERYNSRWSLYFIVFVPLSR